MKDQLDFAISLGVAYAASSAAVPSDSAEQKAAKATAAEAKKAFVLALATAFETATRGEPTRLGWGLSAVAGILYESRLAIETVANRDRVRQAFNRLSGQIHVQDGTLVWDWGKGGARVEGELKRPTVKLAETDPSEKLRKLLPQDHAAAIRILAELLRQEQEILAVERAEAQATEDHWAELRDEHSAKRIEVMGADVGAEAAAA